MAGPESTSQPSLLRRHIGHGLFQGVGECEFFNVTADRPFTDAEFRRQILNGIAPPLAQQVDDLLMTVVVPHTLTPFHLHGRIIQVKADRPCPIRKLFRNLGLDLVGHTISNRL